MKFIILPFLLAGIAVMGQEAGDIGFLYLRDGTILQGMVTEMNSFGDVTIAIQDGIILTFEKRRIRRFVYGDKGELFFGNRIPSTQTMTVGIGLSSYYRVGETKLLYKDKDQTSRGVNVNARYVFSPFFRAGLGAAYLQTDWHYVDIFEVNTNAEVLAQLRGIAVFAGTQLGKASAQVKNPIRFYYDSASYGIRTVRTAEVYSGINIFTKRRINYRIALGAKWLNFILFDITDSKISKNKHLYYGFVRFAVGF